MGANEHPVCFLSVSQLLVVEIGQRIFHSEEGAVIDMHLL